MLRPHLIGRSLVVVALAFVALLVGAVPASANPAAEQRFLQLLNGERTSRGIAALTPSGDLAAIARSQSGRMADQNSLSHNSSLTTQVTNWSSVAENVGYGGSADSVHNALMASQGHRANMLNAGYTDVGIGVVVRDGRVWVTTVFRRPTVAAPVAAPAPAANPIGALDSLRRVPGGIEVRGWTIDPDTAGSRDVHVYVNGVSVGAVTADQSRPDVGAAFPGSGPDHGYTLTVGAREGNNTICAYGINAGPGNNTLLGCRTFENRVSPFGRLDTASVTSGGLHLRGWGLDPDTAKTILAHVWVDGAPLTAFTMSFDRPDVAAAYPGYGGTRAFDVVVPLPPGARQACAYGINVGAGTNGLLGCRDVT